jgi:hypothetical protein
MEAISAAQMWTGRILSGIAVAFLVFDAVGKIMRVEPVVEGTVKLGYRADSVVTVGLLLLAGVVLYVVPRTSLLGAIYLAAYLGGAVATHYRVGSPLLSHVLFPVYVALLLWGGLALRTPRLASLLTGVSS